VTWFNTIKFDKLIATVKRVMHLVIVESPAKCKKIASFLGTGYQVLATMGHIRALDDDLDAVGINRDFEPRYKFLTDKAKATKPIIDAAKRAEKIYLAADDDREGEAIAFSVACLLKKDPLSFPRIVFHEITKDAICKAVANPRKIDMNRVNAQQARAVLDMLVGFTISPLLWKHVAKGLSAGRCQTPALRLISDRESVIKTHSTETTWGFSGEFCSDFSFQAQMVDEVEDQESAFNYLENICEDSTAIISKIVQSPWKLNPPKPFITSTLQQEASALFGMNPKVTMKTAQTLYESGHITYMRTDCITMAEEAIAAAKAQVKELYGDKYISTASATAPATASKDAKDVKGQAQEAHECIRPTHFEVTMTQLGPFEQKLYTLIRKRAIQSVMSAATGQKRTLTLLLEADENKFPWCVSWSITEFEGWQIMGKAVSIDDEEEVPEDMLAWKNAQKLTQSTKLSWTSIKASPKRSRASPRFTEATLVRELEKRGIGRPSTFASLVEVLFDKGYVEKQDIPGKTINHTSLTIKPTQWPPFTQVTQITVGAEKQKMVPTALGESVIGFCVREFPQLFMYEFTEKMEKRLDSVSKGDCGWKDVCKDTWNLYKADYDRLNSKASKPTEKVQEWGNGFKAVMSKNGPLLLQEGDTPIFYTFPPDKTISTITEEEARAWIASQVVSLGSWEGKQIEKKKGPYGFYLQCGEYRIPYVDSDTIEQIYEKFKVRSTTNQTRIGTFIFAVGQYGPYMYKDSQAKKKFVSIPSSINPKNLTEAEASALYKNGLEASASRGRGGRGGRGRGQA